jgi:hypothetical protein
VASFGVPWRFIKVEAEFLEFEATLMPSAHELKNWFLLWARVLRLSVMVFVHFVKQIENMTREETDRGKRQERPK